MRIRKSLISAFAALCLCVTSLPVSVLASDVSEDTDSEDIQLLNGIPEESEEAEDIVILSEGEMEALEAEENDTADKTEDETDETDEEEPAAEPEEETVEDDDPGRARLAGDIPSEFYGDGGIQSYSMTLKDVTHPARYSSGYTITQGIDVSKWDGSINWTKVKNAGIDFAIIRMGNRGSSTGTISTDPYAVTNLKGAVNAGVPFGIYIFSQAISTSEAKKEADYAIKVMEDAGYGKKISLPVVMDFEYYSPNDKAQGRLYDAKLSKSKATEICNAFCSEVKAKGYTPMVYANTDMLTNNLNAGSINGEIWAAQYNSKKTLTYTGDISIWQYSASGSVPGISGNVDMDYRYVKSSKTTTSNSSSSSSSSKKTYTKYKTTTSVNYRLGAGTSYARKGTLAKGKQINVEDGYSKKANGYTWKRFKMNSKNYYIASKYIKKVSSSSSSSSSKTYVTYKTTTQVYYRSGPGTSYSKKGLLSKGKKISVEKGYSKKANGKTWYRFKMNGKNYYIASKHITKVYASYKTTTEVYYRSGPGTSYSKKGTLSKGKTIKVDKSYSKKANGYTWKKFKMNGKIYYVASKYIKKA